jgi:hypothetical protein
VAKPKFSFEAAEPLSGSWELVLRVENGGKQTRWKINYRTTSRQLYQIFGEVMMELCPLERTPPEKAVRDLQQAKQNPDVPEDTQMSEEGSAELRAAKARSVEKTGKQWFSNMEEAGELPLYTIGHGDAE